MKNDDFSTELINVICIERDAGYSITVLCKNEKCMTYYNHDLNGICLVCEKKCKGHRTSRMFHFRHDDKENEKVNAEIDNYQCKKCGGKEFITPFDVPNIN